MENFDLEKWTHRAMPLLIAAIIVTAPATFLPDNWWGRAVNMLTLVPMLLLVGLNMYHGKTFCEYCAAKAPADGLGAARRKSRMLKFFHSGVSKTGAAYLIALLVVPSLVPRVWPSFIVWAAFQPLMLTWLWSNRVHSMLEPWCPWCNGGDGGDGGLREVSPDPSVPEKV